MGRPRPSRTTQVSSGGRAVPEKRELLFASAPPVLPQVTVLWETSIPQIHWRMLAVGEGDDSFSSPSESSGVTSAILWKYSGALLRFPTCPSCALT